MDWDLETTGTETALSRAQVGMATAGDILAEWQTVAVYSGDLVADNGLETALFISLFTDRLAEVDDDIGGGSDRRGWWADQYLEINNDLIGSRLWLLRREKATQDVLGRAVEYARESLEWLIDDGIASSVDVAAKYSELGKMNLTIEVHQADRTLQVVRFAYVWNRGVAYVL